MTRDFNRPRSRSRMTKLNKANGRRQSRGMRQGCRRRKLVKNGNNVSRQLNVPSKSNTATQRCGAAVGSVDSVAVMDTMWRSFGVKWPFDVKWSFDVKYIVINTVS